MPSTSGELRGLIEEIEDPKLRKRALDLLNREDPRKEYRGFFSRADDRGRAGIAPWKQSTAIGPAGQSRIVEKTYNVPIRDDMRPAPIQKRTHVQRVESLARRFWETIQQNPALAPAVLREIQAEYWKAGEPVTFEDCRRAAIELLRRVEQEMKDAGRTK